MEKSPANFGEGNPRGSRRIQQGRAEIRANLARGKQKIRRDSPEVRPGEESALENEAEATAKARGKNDDSQHKSDETEASTSE